MGKATQQFVAPVMVHDRFADYGAEPRHPVGEPFGHVAAVQRQVGASGSSALGHFLFPVVRSPG